MQQPEREDQMREPDFAGLARVWRIRHTTEAEAAHGESWGYGSSSLSDYIVNGPYHPFWSWWYVGLVHLRPLDGAPPANKQYPEAEYELMCMSLDPDPKDGRPKTPDLDKIEAGDVLGGLPGFLSPPDWIVQFHGVADDQAREVAEHAARAIAHGQSCDSDFRSWWNAAIPNTVKHVRGEPH